MKRYSCNLDKVGLEPGAFFSYWTWYGFTLTAITTKSSLRLNLALFLAYFKHLSTDGRLKLDLFLNSEGRAIHANLVSNI